MRRKSYEMHQDKNGPTAGHQRPIPRNKSETHVNQLGNTKSNSTAVAASPCTTPAGLHVHRVDLTKRKAVESPGTPSTRKVL